MTTEKKEVVETIYGKHAKYEIVKSSGGVIAEPKYYIYKNGNYYRGYFSSLREAVEAAKKEQ